MILFTCTIPGRAYVKKNTSKKWRGRVVYTPQYEGWRATATKHIKMAMGLSPAMFPFDGQLGLKVLFYFENHQAEPDLSALYEGPQDVLQECGVITNDRQFNSHDGSRKIFGEEAKTEIEIWRIA